MGMTTTSKDEARVQSTHACCDAGTSDGKGLRLAHDRPEPAQRVSMPGRVAKCPVVDVLDAADEQARALYSRAIEDASVVSPSIVTNRAIATKMGWTDSGERHVREMRGLAEGSHRVALKHILAGPREVRFALARLLLEFDVDAAPPSRVPLSHRGILATASGAEVGTAIVRAEADGVVTPDEHAQIASVAMRAAVGFSQLAAESRAASRFPRKAGSGR